MSRKRKNPPSKPTPTAPQPFARPQEGQATEARPRPNKRLLAAAILLETGWLTLLLILAITG